MIYYEFIEENGQPSTVTTYELDEDTEKLLTIMLISPLVGAEAIAGVGEAEVKVCTLPSGEKRCYPEYAAAERLAAKNGISYQDALEQIKREAQEKFQ